MSAVFHDRFYLQLEPEFAHGGPTRRRVTGFKVTGMRRTRPPEGISLQMEVSMPANIFDMRVQAAIDEGAIIVTPPEAEALPQVCPECQEIAHDPDCPLVGDGRLISGA